LTVGFSIRIVSPIINQHSHILRNRQHNSLYLTNVILEELLISSVEMI